MLCTLVAKYLCIYFFYSGATTNTTETEMTNISQKVTTISTKKAPVVCTPASHQYPVASNGKLLDVAVIGEGAQSTQKPQSDSDVKVLGVTKQTQHKGKVREKD